MRLGPPLPFPSAPRSPPSLLSMLSRKVHTSRIFESELAVSSLTLLVLRRITSAPNLFWIILGEVGVINKIHNAH